LGEVIDNDVLEPDGDDQDVDRRTFIAGAGALTGAFAFNQAAQAAVFRAPHTVTPRSLLGNPILLLEGVTAKTTTINVRRRVDMLSLRVDAINMKRSGQNLVRDIGSQPSYLVVTFEPQHLTERAYFETKANVGTAGGNEPPDSPGGASALLAQPSRLAFQVPNGHKIPYTIAGLLDWSALDLSLTPAAAYSPRLPLFILGRRKRHRGRKARDAHAAALSPHLGVEPTLPTAFPKATILNEGPGIPEIRAPLATETSIELPWHLAISPVAGAQFSHLTGPETSDGTTELWHTRLAKRTAPSSGDGGAIRAVWNFDTQTSNFASPGTPTLSDKNNPPDEDKLGPFRMSLTPNDRWQIVHLTSDFTLGGRADVEASKLWLTARGGYLDSDGTWDEKTRSLVEWKHLATLGRDHYVKVTTKGFLFPFGHRVVEITVTERDFEQLTPGGEIVATLRQYIYLVVRQPIMSYDPSQTFGIADNSRDFPFRSIECMTLRTPDLDLPTNFTPSTLFLKDTNFVPTVSGQAFRWHFVGTDWVGRTLPFTAEAVFVGYDDATDPLASLVVRNHYNSLNSNDPLRVADFYSQPIAYAQSLTTGDTDLHTKTMSFGCAPGLGGTQNQFETVDTAQCYPTLSPSINGFNTGAQAVVRMAAAEAISGGQPLNGNALPTVAYYPPYVAEGFSTSGQITGNAGNVFMEILFSASNASNLTFSGGSSGGVMTPNLQLQGISRSLGPVADLDNIFSGKFDPNSIFAGLSSDLQANLLGGVTLGDLLAPVENFLNGGTPEVPNPQALRIGYTTDGTVVTTSLAWKPNIITNNPVITPRTDGGGATSFELDATITTDLAAPNNSNFTILGTLKNFDFSLISTGSDQFIVITFDSLTFSSSSGTKANTSVQIASVNFVGPLKFVEQLSQYMSFAGGGGLKIQLKPTEIYADLLVELPTIAVGLFTLSGIGIDANFTLPFDGSPAVFGFGFSTMANPFQLSIAIFGGGGYFGIQLGTDGLHGIDAGFDFGAMAAINLGVASGSVSLTAGFQYTYMVDPSTGKNSTTLTGYVKLQGSLSILGIITMTLTFDLSLTYMESSGGGSAVTGSATVTLSISILFFSFSVSATATKTFSNSGGSGHAVRGSDVRAHIGTTPETNPTFASQMSASDWATYCAAFAS
jgi:hypothetical protein